MNSRADGWLASGALLIVVAFLATSCGHESSAAQDAKNSCKAAGTFWRDIDKLPPNPESPTSYIVYNPNGTIPIYPTTTVTPTIRSVGARAVNLADSAAKRDQRFQPLATAVSNFIQIDPLGPDPDSSHRAMVLMEQCAIAKARV